MSSDIDRLWSALEAHLARRYQELFDEVRHYPTPIAHCDDQIPKLIEQRTHALEQLRRVREAAPPSAPTLRALLKNYPRSDDDAEMELVDRLRAALIGDDGSPGHVIPGRAGNLLLDRH